MNYDAVIQFWFELEPKRWWTTDEALDLAIRTRFGEVHRAANRCELFTWRQQPLGRLAEIIVLDQFSRNIHRGTPGAFASDALALVLAQEAVNIRADQELDKSQRSFLYMPYMHSESKVIHVAAERLFKASGNENTYQFELKHKTIVDRFGRYPHRNATLGRESTADEVEFLKQPGSSF